jgi:hypothetical protein
MATEQGSPGSSLRGAADARSAALTTLVCCVAQLNAIESAGDRSAKGSAHALDI